MTDPGEAWWQDRKPRVCWIFKWGHDVTRRINSDDLPSDEVSRRAKQLTFNKQRTPIGWAHVQYHSIGMFWARCDLCRSVDLFDSDSFDLAGEAGPCSWCNGKNIGSAVPGATVRLMNQELATAAFLLGGLPAVSAL